jgi:hypothetical protein
MRKGEEEGEMGRSSNKDEDMGGRGDRKESRWSGEEGGER